MIIKLILFLQFFTTLNKNQGQTAGSGLWPVTRPGPAQNPGPNDSLTRDPETRFHLCAPVSYRNGLTHVHTFFSIFYVSPVIRVFKIPTGSPLMIALNTGGIYKFRDVQPISGYMWETIQDRDGNRKLYAFYRTVTFRIILSDIWKSFQYCRYFVCTAYARSVSDSSVSC